MLNTNGDRLMGEFHVQPGPTIGWVLNALLEDVLNDSSLNTQEYLDSKTKELLALPTEKLKELGDSGVKKKEMREEEELQKIAQNNHV
jgi:tRNA nucleotidyltransferase (CCA-adding enzyme)